MPVSTSTRNCLQCQIYVREADSRFCSALCNNVYHSLCVVCRKVPKQKKTSRYCSDECKKFGICLMESGRAVAPKCRYFDDGDCQGICFYKHPIIPTSGPDARLLRNGNPTVMLMVGEALSTRITNYLIDLYSKSQSPSFATTGTGKVFETQGKTNQPADRTHNNTGFFDGKAIELAHISTERALRWGINASRATNVIYMEIVKGNPLDVMRTLSSDENFSRFVQRMMVLNNVFSTKGEALHRITTKLGETTSPARVYGFPASIQAEIVDACNAQDTNVGDDYRVVLDPVNYTKVAFLMHVPHEETDSYYTGFEDLQISEDRDNIEHVAILRKALQCKPKQGEKQVSRAYYKIEEVFRRTEIVDWMLESSGQAPVAPQTAMDTSYDNGVALDIGAAPGGWSYWLAARCSKVVAVDPGMLKEPIPENVIHVADRIENFLLPEMQAKPELGGGLKFNLLVCDMNISPDDCMTIVSSAKELLAPNAALVVTLKNHLGGLKHMFKNTEPAAHAFAALCDPSTVRKFQLLSGREQEYTMVGRVKAELA
eukprot:CFRG5207T1